jgi:glucose-1-phosphate adenylyltransferase
MDKVVGIITANYETRALRALTEERTIASLPYGGRYRLIDFPLSNMVNSGISTIGLITPYKYRSIIDHIGVGSEWSLDRKMGGLYILPGTVFGISTATSRFLIRDFIQNQVYLMRSPAEYVLVTAANTVYNMDYTDLYQAHLASGADITLVYHEATEDDADIMSISSENGRVTGMRRGVRKGEDAFLDCFILKRELLLDVLDWYGALDYLDFFEALENQFKFKSVRMFRYDGYARSIFNVHSYFQSNMDLLDYKTSTGVFSKESPILTKGQDTVPADYLEGSSAKNSLISAGCVIGGTVEKSILFRSVTVEPGAVVRNSIIMQNCTIKAGAVVENAIIDRRNVVQADTMIKGSPNAIFIKEKEWINVK